MTLPTMRTLACLIVAATVSLSCGGVPALGDGTAGLTARVAPPAATVVLVHGWGGFQAQGELDYFYGIPELYRSLGARVFVPAVSPVNTVEERAGQLKDQLDQVPGPLILLAHSQGGLDARYLVSQLGYGDRVAAVVTIATPHHDTQVADVAAGLVPAPIAVGVN